MSKDSSGNSKKPKPVMATKAKTTAEVLKEALAAKKAATAKNAQKLRPDMGKGTGPNKDAERLRGMSRKVH